MRLGRMAYFVNLRWSWYSNPPHYTVHSHSPSICSLTMTKSTFWWRALMPGLLLMTVTLPNRSSSFLNCIEIDSLSPDLECSIDGFANLSSSNDSGQSCDVLK